VIRSKEGLPLRRAARAVVGLGLVWALLALGCGKKTTTLQSAPSAHASARPAPPVNTHFVIDTPGSSVGFTIDAPLEKIRGELKDAVSGDLFVDLKKLEDSNGRVEVDLEKLALFEQKRKNEKHEFSESARNEQQNREAREWLQLEAREGEIAEEQAKRNRFPKFTLDRLDNVSASDLSALTGPERNVGADARGSLLLHGRTNKKTVKLALTFVYANDAVKELRVATSEPFPIALEDYDVNPRNRVGKQVKTIQEALAGEYAKKLSAQVLVELSFSAKPR
jgi:hypothetical protein